MHGREMLREHFTSCFGKDFKIPEQDNIFDSYKLLLDVNVLDGYPKAAPACFISRSA